MSETHYDLQPEEKEYLDANYSSSSWRFCLPEGGKCGIVICEFPVPPGYTPEKADMMIIIPQGYPATHLDMFYFSPPLQKTNGKSINSLETENHFGSDWQRWSRHYTWVAGQDNIIRHIEFVKNALKKELGA